MLFHTVWPKMATKWDLLAVKILFVLNITYSRLYVFKNIKMESNLNFYLVSRMKNRKKWPKMASKWQRHKIPPSKVKNSNEFGFSGSENINLVG